MSTAELIQHDVPFEIEPITYPVIKAKIAEMADEYMPLTVAGIDDARGLKLVHAARMVVKNHRVEIEKRRKALKESSLKYGKLVDQAAKDLTALLEPIESHLEAEENKVAAEKERIRREAEDRQRQEIQARLDALQAVHATASWALLESLSDEDFATELAEATEAYNKAQAEEAERRRVAEEQAAQQKAEAERLAAERAEIERQKAELAEQQRKIDEAKAAEQRKIDQEREARERAEREERIRIEAESRAKREAEERFSREEADRKAKAEADERERQRQEALKPDREKLVALAAAIANVDRPAVSDKAASSMAAANVIIARAVDGIRKLAEQL